MDLVNLLIIFGQYPLSLTIVNHDDSSYSLVEIAFTKLPRASRLDDRSVKPLISSDMWPNHSSQSFAHKLQLVREIQLSNSYHWFVTTGYIYIYRIF